MAIPSPISRRMSAAPKSPFARNSRAPGRRFSKHSANTPTISSTARRRLIMNPNDDARDEAPLASLFAPLEKDVAAPDKDVLARLRAQSTEAFAVGAGTNPTLGERKRPMFLRMAN